MRGHRNSLQKPKVYLTFDLERDYTKAGYLTPPSFTGIRHRIGPILDLMKDHGAEGTFFLTPEVIIRCEDLVRAIHRRHAIGLHSHAYYHPEFKGWRNDGDAFRKYSREDKERMILRDVELYRDYLGDDPKLFRIGRLEPDETVLRTISKSGCLCDSSYHSKNYGIVDRLKVARLYHFRELPVDFHLFALTLHHLQKDPSVVLIHPSLPPDIVDPEVHDDKILFEIIRRNRDTLTLAGMSP